jgi:hypothetical protein
MPDLTPPLDPWSADDLSEGRPDPLRTVCLPAPTALDTARAIASLANARGGDVLLGMAAAADGAIVSTNRMDADAAESLLAAALAIVDPPVGHLVKTRWLADTGVFVVRVRLSPSTPHLVTETGEIPRLEREGLQPVRSRRALDDLYARGRGERERADRLVDAMIEKLVMAHYAFYNIAVIACTQAPSGEPYRVAGGGMLAPADDPFVSAFALHEHEPRIGPGEIELRSPGETGAYLRITRSGAVAVGEVQRRPYHDELDTVERLHDRIAALARCACRLLGHAADAVIVPHLFLEGVRGLRLVQNAATRATTGRAPQDTTRYPLMLGDARDQEYAERLAAEAMTRLTAFFPPADG